MNNTVEISSDGALTVLEAAEELGVSYMTIYRLIGEGKLKARRWTPRKTRITREALEEFKANSEANFKREVA